jgi:type IV secretory pathway VirB2 component (pilin)
MLSIHLRIGLPSGLFPSGFPTNNLYTFLFSPVAIIIIIIIIIIMGADMLPLLWSACVSAVSGDCCHVYI